MGLLFNVMKSHTTRSLERAIGGRGSVRAFRNGRYHIWVNVHYLRPRIQEELEGAGLVCEPDAENGNVLWATVPGKTSMR